MHQGKHQEYEKRLHDALIAQMQQQGQQPTTGSSNPGTESPDSTSSSGSSSSSSSSGSESNGISKSNNVEAIKDHSASGGNNGQIQKEAWPSLSTSPVTIKENKMSMKGSELV